MVAAASTWSCITSAWTGEELIGTWQAEEPGVQAMTVIGKTYAAFVLVHGEQKPFQENPATEAELANAFRSSSAATLKFDALEPGRWSMEYLISLDPNLVGVRVLYDYEWLDDNKTRMQYWVLDENGKRTGVTGVSRKL